jgi:hypothetical protein
MTERFDILETDAYKRVALAVSAQHAGGHTLAPPKITALYPDKAFDVAPQQKGGEQGAHNGDAYRDSNVRNYLCYDEKRYICGKGEYLDYQPQLDTAPYPAHSRLGHFVTALPHHRHPAFL